MAIAISENKLVMLPCCVKTGSVASLHAFFIRVKKM